MADPSRTIPTLAHVDQQVAGLLNTGTSATRAALNALLPKTSGSTVPGSIPQLVKQRVDGTWPNPVTTPDVNGRLFAAFVDPSKRPGVNAGVTVNDLLVGATGWFFASTVTSLGVTWQPITGATTGGPTTPTTPDDTTTPTTPTDNTPASATARPYALLGTTGTWSSTGTTTVLTALADQAASGVTATPDATTGGVSISLDMSNFSHSQGNTLNVTLWGAASSTPGNVTVSLGKGSTTYASAKSAQVNGTASNLVFTWLPDEQLSLTADQWRDIELTVVRASGGFTALTDITLQSLPPVTPPGPVDTSDAAMITWANGAVWTSQVSAAPLSVNTSTIATFIRNQVGTGNNIRLDCLPGGDALPIWMVPATQGRVNIVGPTSSTRGDVTLMSNTAGTGALQNVPMPTSATTPSSLFKTAAVACIETRQLWELIGLTKTATGWSADWGARVDDTTKSSGALANNTGFTGSGLAATAGVIKVSEAKAAAGGQIDAIQHAIAINLPYGAVSAQYCWPATRSDSNSSDGGAPQMGQRLRIKPTFNPSTSATLTPLGKAIVTAMQKFGAVIMGGSPKTSILCESGEVEAAKTGTDPWGAILAGKTIDTALAGFPLDQLEVVSPGWGGPNWVAETPPTTTTPTTPTTPTPTTSGSKAIEILGTPRSGLPWHSGVKADGPYNTANVEKFAAWRGRPVDFGLTYPEYDFKTKKGDATRQDIINSGWCTTLYNGFAGKLGYGFAPFPSNPFSAQANDNGYLWQQLANGAFDDVIDGQANFLTNGGRGDSIVRVAWEWNGDWYTWRCGLAGISAFKAGFQRIVTRMRAKSSKFKFIFEINAATALRGDGAGLGALTKAYPGDAYVDMVGIDMYQFYGEGGGTGAFSNYLRQTTQFGGQGPRLDDVADFARAHNKGVAIMEWGIHGTSGYGDRPDYIEGMWNWLVANKDVVAAESYFNEYGSYIQCSLYNSLTGELQNPKSAAKYKALWGAGVK